MPTEMDAPFTRLELVDMAREIIALDCSEKSQVHAEKMLLVKDDEYSRSFFEAATRIRELMSTGSSLEAAVKSVAGWIPSIEGIEFKLCWWECDIVSVTKKQLYDIAAEIEEFQVTSPDRNLAVRICSKKASKDEWRLFALRYVDYKTRISRFDVLLWDFCSDVDRTKREIAALKPWISKVCVTGDRFDVERPVMPPWRDFEFWEADLDEWGFGDDFSPSFPTQSSSVIALKSHIPTAQNKAYTDVLVDGTQSSDEEHNPAYNDEVVNKALIDDEDYEVDTLDGDVFEDEELYAAQDAEKKRLLADAVNLPQSFHIEHLNNRTAQKFPQLAWKSTGSTAVAKEHKLKATVLTDEEKEQRWADAVMLTEAMSFSSFKEEMRASEEDRKKDPDNKLLNMACDRLLDSLVRFEAREEGIQDKSKQIQAAGTGSDLAGTSASLPPTGFLPENLDPNAYSQLIAPLESGRYGPHCPHTNIFLLCNYKLHLLVPILRLCRILGSR